MMRMSEFERHKRAADLLLDLRESYKILDVFGAMLQDRGDTELATRIFRVINTVGDCCGLLNDFMQNFNVSVIDTVNQNGRQENLNDTQ